MRPRTEGRVTGFHRLQTSATRCLPCATGGLSTSASAMLSRVAEMISLWRWCWRKISAQDGVYPGRDVLMPIETAGCRWSPHRIPPVILRQARRVQGRRLFDT